MNVFEAALDQSADGILLLDSRAPGGEPIVVYANAAYQAMTGYRAVDLHEAPAIPLLCGKDPSGTIQGALRGAIKMRCALTFEVASGRKDGNVFIADISFSPVLDSGTCTHWLAVLRDVTASRRRMRESEKLQARSDVQREMHRAAKERARAAQTLLHLASHDFVTNLPNRSHFLQSVGANLDGSEGGALIAIDLDRFRLLALRYGRPACDQVLREVAARLQHACDALVGHIAPDTFAVWLPRAGYSDAITAARKIMREFAAPASVSFDQVPLKASIGVALARPQAAAEQLMREADIATCRAKQLGGSRYEIFLPDDDVTDELWVALNLDDALERDEFHVHYQPIIDIRSETVAAVEALVRWKHPKRGIVSPGLFVPIAEDTGQIVEIGRRVLLRACRDAARMPVRGRAAATVHVNVSGVELSTEDFTDVVFTALSDYSLPGERLCVEITETALARNVDVAVANLERLAAAGIKISMDDFGTGYSSLANLRRFPVHELKIDRTFISGSRSTGVSDHDIVQMIVSLGQARGLPVVAEGIEHERQLLEAKALGCVRAQGYFIGKPAPIEDVLEHFPGFHAQAMRA